MLIQQSSFLTTVDVALVSFFRPNFWQAAISSAYERDIWLDVSLQHLLPALFLEENCWNHPATVKAVLCTVWKPCVLAFTMEE